MQLICNYIHPEIPQNTLRSINQHRANFKILRELSLSKKSGEGIASLTFRQVGLCGEKVIIVLPVLHKIYRKDNKNLKILNPLIPVQCVKYSLTIEKFPLI